MKTLLEFITANSALLGVIVTVCGGLFAFIRWIDSRRSELREKRYSRYMDLIGTIAGRRPDGNKPNLMDQIAAVWFLLEYKEYKMITKRIFSNQDWLAMANPEWNQHILPHIKMMLEEIAQ